MRNSTILFLLSNLMTLSLSFAAERNARWPFSSRSKKVLARKVSSGGFCTPCIKTETQILADGTIKVIKTQFGNNEVNPNSPNSGETKTTVMKLFKLDKKFLKKFKKDLLTFPKELPLENTDPELPTCSDIPEVHYSILSKGQELKVGEDKLCHKFRAKDFKGNEIIDLLNSVRAFERYFEEPTKDPVEPGAAPGTTVVTPTTPGEGPSPRPIPSPNPRPTEPVLPPTRIISSII